MASTRLSPGKAPSSSSIKSSLRGERLLIAICVSLVSALAWAHLLHLNRQINVDADYESAMAAMGMSLQPDMTAMDALLTFSMWVVMMVGMMAPAVAPVLLLFASMRPAHDGKRKTSGETVMFALGYGAAWISFSAVATILQLALRKAALLSASLAFASPSLSSAILMAAGIYQLTPWKNTCLAHCRTPLGFILSKWRSGKAGAFQMGWHHGLFCLGCCWALMIVLFAVGVMNLLWVAALTMVVLLEKIAPKGTMLARVFGIVLVILGVASLMHPS